MQTVAPSILWMAGQIQQSTATLYDILAENTKIASQQIRSFGLAKMGEGAAVKAAGEKVADVITQEAHSFIAQAVVNAAIPASDIGYRTARTSNMSSEYTQLVDEGKTIKGYSDTLHNSEEAGLVSVDKAERKPTISDAELEKLPHQDYSKKSVNEDVVKSLKLMKSGKDEAQADFRKGLYDKVDEKIQSQKKENDSAMSRYEETTNRRSQYLNSAGQAGNLAFNALFKSFEADARVKQAGADSEVQYAQGSSTIASGSKDLAAKTQSEAEDIIQQMNQASGQIFAANRA